jgi:hypothetical protein
MRLAALVTVVLPRLLSMYGEHLAQAPPVSEAPVIEVLQLVVWTGQWEVQQGADLLRRAPAEGATSGAAEAGKVASFCHEIERLFEGPPNKSPGDWPS